MGIPGKIQRRREVEDWVREEYGDEVLEVFIAMMDERQDLDVHDVLQLALEAVFQEEVAFSRQSLEAPFRSEQFFVPIWEADEGENGKGE